MLWCVTLCSCCALCCVLCVVLCCVVLCCVVLCSVMMLAVRFLWFMLFCKVLCDAFWLLSIGVLCYYSALRCIDPLVRRFAVFCSNIIQIKHSIINFDVTDFNACVIGDDKEFWVTCSSITHMIRLYWIGSQTE